MVEGYVNLFENEHAGTNRPHFKGYMKIDGVDHEFALWPAKEGKKGYSGKFKPKEIKADDQTKAQSIVDEARKVFDDPIPF